MNLLANEIVERFYSFLWPMLRVSALLLSAPIFSLRSFNLRLRILLAGALTWMIYPLFQWPSLDPLSGPGMVEIFNQIAIGLVMGLSMQIITAAILLAGQSISNAMGLSIATMMDPNLGNVPVIAQFMLILSTLIFVGLGGHAMLLGLVVDSFYSMPVGKGLLTDGAWAHFFRSPAGRYTGHGNPTFYQYRLGRSFTCRAQPEHIPSWTTGHDHCRIWRFDPHTAKHGQSHRMALDAGFYGGSHPARHELVQ